MKTVTFTRALGLGVTAVLVSSAFQFTPASAAVPAPTSLALKVLSQDGLFFEPGAYAASDIAVQVEDDSAKPSVDYDIDDARDLTYSWDYTPFAGGKKTLPDAEQATDVNGKFVVPLPVDQGPGTYTLKAQLDAGSASDPGTKQVTETFTVGNDAPAGSTATITGLGSSKPGVAQAGVLKVANAGKPVEGQVFSLTVDHGFFTPNGATPTAGARAGNLQSAGTKLTGLTNADGEIPFAVGIARDADFDDDAKAVTTVKAVSGPATSAPAAWSTADPLNGQVDVRLSPASEQDGPVNPALAGNRTFYDVFALDQFGNPVQGAEIVLDFPGSVDQDSDSDFDADTYDVVSDLRSFGDVAVTLYKPGYVDVTGTWEDAPVTVVGGPANAVRDAVGSLRSSTYGIQFSASQFSMSSSAADTVRVGSTVTQTVRAVDQLGNAIEGYQVRFLRYGPDDVRGDVVASKTTNALGEATYTFIGTRAGRSTITAEVTDGNRRRELTGSAAFGTSVRARLTKTKGTSAGRGADRLTVSAGRATSGARVDLYRVVKGVEKRVASKKAGRKGTVNFKIRDKNSSKRTTYVAVVRSTSKTVADRSNGFKTR